MFNESVVFDVNEAHFLQGESEGFLELEVLDENPDGSDGPMLCHEMVYSQI